MPEVNLIQCPFCKINIPEDNDKCPHCESDLDWAVIECPSCKERTKIQNTPGLKQKCQKCSFLICLEVEPSAGQKVAKAAGSMILNYIITVLALGTMLFLGVKFGFFK